MGLSVQQLHELEAELGVVKRKIPPLHYRWRRAGAFKTRDRIDAKIEQANEEIRVLEKRLINSWGA